MVVQIKRGLPNLKIAHCLLIHCLPLFEQLGGTYHEKNGYLIPDLKLPEEERTIGIWGAKTSGISETAP